jgi:hypothetical protein
MRCGWVVSAVTWKTLQVSQSVDPRVPSRGHRSHQFDGRTPRLRSMSFPIHVVNATEAGEECTKALKRGPSPTPSSPMTISPSSSGSQCAGQEGGRRVRDDPNCTRCHGHGVVREPEQLDHLDVSLVSSLNQAPMAFPRHPPFCFCGDLQGYLRSQTYRGPFAPWNRSTISH